MTDKLKYERELLSRGYKYICGVDEVGRGPLAGPVVCAAVIMPFDDIIEASLIEKKAVALNICLVEPEKIDEINILEATKLCMKNAVEGLKIKPDFVITDGNMKLDIDMEQASIVKGDALSYTIGSASIAAKVYRDKLMDGYAGIYPQYGFEKHKGYGTSAHIDAIKTNGLCPVHRRSFTKKWQ